MTDEKASRKELEARLSAAETAVKAIRESKIDALIGKKGVYILRLKEMEDALKAEHAQLVQTEQALQRTHDELELRVLARTAELEKAYDKLTDYNMRLEDLNKELRDFAFIASHDLQEPLRKVHTFADMIASESGPSLNDNSRDYLKRMQSSTARMQDLLDSLLSYSRVTTRAAPVKETSLRESVEIALSNLEFVIQEKNAVVEIEDHLPTIKADRVQMIQLFQNLIGNALKFCRQERSPHVRVYARRQDESGACEICVEDDGIGFEVRYLDKLFIPFQRLHGRNSPYPGVGIGLAICKKIMAKHGGEITAKSELGRGSTFIVNFPAEQKERD